MTSSAGGSGGPVTHGGGRRGRGLVSACAVLLVAGALGNAAAGEGMDAALRLYQESEFSGARRIAAEHLPGPVARLVYHLCRVHDAKDKDVAGGLAGLRALYEDAATKSRHETAWAEAALSYARTVQLFQIRSLHPEYADVDVRKVYRDIIAAVPDGVHACTAVTYLAETYMQSEQKARQDEGFSLVEGFLAAYAGPERDTVPVHLYIEGYYVSLRGDYEASFRHLKKAYELGMAKELLKRVTLFRMARTCEVKLARGSEAEAYYRQFLGLFPNDRLTPIARRYLAGLTAKEK